MKHMNLLTLACSLMICCYYEQIEDQTKVSKFEQEIREEQEERRRLEEEKRQRRIAFRNTVDIFKQMNY